MSKLPGVYSQQSDFALGSIAAAAGGKMFAIVGPAVSGPIGSPSAFARWEDARAIFGGGPLLEAAAYYIETYKKPALLCRCAGSTAAAVGTVAHSAGAGTSAVTVKTGAAPIDNYELALEFLADGTIGVAGITYRMSLDNGRTWSNTMSLGTATEAAFPDSAGVTFEFAAGTVKKGDLHTAVATCEQPNGTDLNTALDGLKVTLAQWGIVLFTEEITSTTFDNANAVATYSNGHHTWIGSPRIGATDETDGAYQTSLAALSAAKSSGDGGLFGGGCKLTSPVSGRSYRRPAGWPAAAVQASVEEHVNTAEPRRGALPGVSIRDVNGMPDEHDEAIYPGLDDMRYGSLRTWPRRQGVYITLPRTFAPTGSDFDIFPNRLVMNLVDEVLTDVLTNRIHRPILVSRKTGLILPSEAADIKAECDGALAAAVMAAPKASGVAVAVSTTDNLLSNPTLNVYAAVLPLAYPRWINLGLAFRNPALQIQAV